MKTDLVRIFKSPSAWLLLAMIILITLNRARILDFTSCEGFRLEMCGRLDHGLNFLGKLVSWGTPFILLVIFPLEMYARKPATRSRKVYYLSYSILLIIALLIFSNLSS